MKLSHYAIENRVTQEKYKSTKFEAVKNNA